jgi:TolA-binding protein
LRQEAVLGEGWAELAANNHRAALTFFQSKLSAAQQEKSDTLRFGAMLGLGEALLADVKPREAQLHLARVAALDHTDRDRNARALLRLAESAMLLSDAESRVQAKTWLEVVLSRYGDTPWAAPARQLMEKVR